ncbi:WD40-repeat-containing domain protein [Parasitella parasitica]|nr:WD40-repeat-containing domain protein [Parasitella parasitica]
MDTSSIYQQHCHHKGPFPTELLLSIFIHLDGITLTSCSQVCRQWAQFIAHYDELIWPNACLRDFEKTGTRRFWSLQFPTPRLFKNRRTWQDMYRITRNWYTGQCVKGFHPKSVDAATINTSPCTVIGAPQEQGMFTNLTLANDGRVVRTNPNYRNPAGSQSLVIQSPQTKQRFFLDTGAAASDIPGWPDAASSHSIVCHYTQPNSKWLVTGGLNGTVALWDLETKALIRMWHGHRGRVLCISMNDDVVVSGGSDSMIRVWDLDKSKSSTSNSEWTNHHRPTRRGMIDISSYLSGRSDWYQGVGEIAVNGHLVACAPDASGPILVFSILTGSLVYELRVPEDAGQTSEWVSEDITAFTRLCLTPFFLLTKGKVSNDNKTNRLVPCYNNVVQQRKQKNKSVGYVKKLSDSIDEADGAIPPVAQMTPYQLYKYYQSINKTGSDAEEEQPMPSTSACINVWDLQTGKIVYRLLPTLEKPYQNYSITDVRLTPDYSKVFASIEVRGQKHYKERLYCWDFSLKCMEQSQENFDIIELDNIDPVLRKTGKSWVCYM